MSHTFTDEHGEFVFGPLCANKFYEIVIWVDEVKHCKICTSCKHEGRCLQGIKLECPPCDMHHKKPCDKHENNTCEKPCDDFCEKHCDRPEEKPCDKPWDKRPCKCFDKPCCR